MLGIFNVHTDIAACDCTQGCTNTKRECTESGLQEKNSLVHGDSNPCQDCTWPFGPTLCTHWAIQPIDWLIMFNVDECEVTLASSAIFLFSANLGSRDSSVVRAPDSWSKGFGFKSQHGRWENFLLWGQLSVLIQFGICFIPCFCSECVKDPSHSAKSAGGRLQLSAHASYMWLCMKCRDIMHGVHRTLWDGSSFTWHQPLRTKQHCKDTTSEESVDIQNTQQKSASHSFRITRDKSAVQLKLENFIFQGL